MLRTLCWCRAAHALDLRQSNAAGEYDGRGNRRPSVHRGRRPERQRPVASDRVRGRASGVFRQLAGGAGAVAVPNPGPLDAKET